MSQQSKLKVGVLVDCLRLPVREGIIKTAEMGADGFQIFVTGGEMLVADMTRDARREFVKFYRDQGLTLSALCADFGKNLGDPTQAAEVMPRLKEAVEQALDLGTNVVTTHIGAVHGLNDPAWATMAPILEELGNYASERRIVFATETGLESGAALREVFDNLQTDGVRVNFDPANLVMMGFDHMQAVRDLSPYVAHTHAKDGKKGIGEFPLGEGDVNYPDYIALWRSLGYDGFYTIERETGDDRLGDIGRAIQLLRSL